MIDSPCNKVCVLDQHGVCIGCGRSSVEIASWPQAGDAVRVEILRNAARRRQAMAPDAVPPDNP